VVSREGRRDRQVSCVDGPDFDGHLVDFDDLMFRLQRYRATELAATERFNESCRMRNLTAQPVVAE
jgi:ferredoxin--NADP+ reductase